MSSKPKHNKKLLVAVFTLWLSWIVYSRGMHAAYSYSIQMNGAMRGGRNEYI